MSNWVLRVPHRHRDDPISDAMSAAHALPPEERAVVRNALTELATEHSARTVGDALDLLEQAGPEARRAMLDRARAEAGLPSVEAADATREMAARAATLPSGTAPMRAPNGYLMSPICASPDCMTVPRESTKARRWWCPQHRPGHEDDMCDWSPRFAYGPSGAIVNLDEQEAEIARERERERSRLARREAREAEQAAAAAAAASFDRAQRERHEHESRHQFPSES